MATAEIALAHGSRLDREGTVRNNDREVYLAAPLRALAYGRPLLLPASIVRALGAPSWRGDRAERRP